MKKNRMVALAAAFLLLVQVAAGCAPDYVSDQRFDIAAQQQEPFASSAPEKQEPQMDELWLSYDAGDSLNPYKISGAVNRELVPLMYDSLLEPDNTRKPQYRLAASAEMSDATCVVKLNPAARFTDGSYLTGKDVIYSITTALSSDTVYKSMLRNVAGCSVNGDGDVEILLYRADVDFPAMLAFPIIKEGSADEEFPTGVSKYYVAGADEQGVRLAQNSYYYQPGGRIKTIRLTHAVEPEAIQFKLKTGEIDMSFTDLSASDMVTLSAGAPVSMNNLVYVGLNGRRTLMQNPTFRQALSKAINRDEILVKAYLSHGRTTLFPFHPDFYRLQGMELSAPRSLREAEELLGEMGLDRKDDGGNRLYNNVPITLRMLVNSENGWRTAAASLIAQQLEQLGLQVEVVTESFSQYQLSLQNGNYDLFIGETKLWDNMDVSLLLSGGSLGYDTPYNEDLETYYQGYRSGAMGIGNFLNCFLEQSPFIPLLFREGQITMGKNFSVNLIATEQDLFYNILDW